MKIVIMMMTTIKIITDIKITTINNIMIMIITDFIETKLKIYNHSCKKKKYTSRLVKMGKVVIGTKR